MRLKMVLLSLVAGSGLMALAEDPFVEFTGYQSVDTGYCPNGKTRVEADFALQDLEKTQQRIWSCSDTGKESHLLTHLYVNGSLNFGYCYATNASWQSSEVKSSASRTVAILDAKQKQLRFIRDGQEINKDSNFASRTSDYDCQSKTPIRIGGALGSRGGGV